MFSAVLAFLAANKAVILGVLFFMSEALALIPGIKSNSVFQAIYNWLKTAKGDTAAVK